MRPVEIHCMRHGFPPVPPTASYLPLQSHVALHPSLPLSQGCPPSIDSIFCCFGDNAQHHVWTTEGTQQLFVKAQGSYLLSGSRANETLAVELRWDSQLLSPTSCVRKGRVLWREMITITDNGRGIIFWDNQDMSELLSPVWQGVPQREGQGERSSREGQARGIIGF